MMKLRVLLVVMAVLLVGSLIGGSTLALYTSSTSSQNNSFSSGHLDIALTDSSGEPLQGAIMQVNLMAPGDAPGPFNASLKNTGTLPLVYTYTIVRTDDGGPTNDALASALLLKVERQQANGSWESLGEQSLADWVSDGASDWQPQMAAGALENLRFTAHLPIATGNSAQSAAVKFTLLVNATQPIVAGQPQQPQTETWNGSYISNGSTWRFISSITRNGNSFVGTMTELDDTNVGTSPISGTISGSQVSGTRSYPVLPGWNINVTFTGTLNPDGILVVNGNWSGAYGTSGTWAAEKQ